jgi:hypothetical protein
MIQLSYIFGVFFFPCNTSACCPFEFVEISSYFALFPTSPAPTVKWVGAARILVLRFVPSEPAT